MERSNSEGRRRPQIKLSGGWWRVFWFERGALRMTSGETWRKAWAAYLLHAQGDGIG